MELPLQTFPNALFSYFSRINNILSVTGISHQELCGVYRTSGENLLSACTILWLCKLADKQQYYP